LYLEEKNDCYLDQRQAQQLLQSSTNTNNMRPLYRVNEVLLQDFEDRINEELLADSLQDIHLDANNSIELSVDSNNDIDSDVMTKTKIYWWLMKNLFYLTAIYFMALME
jgi:hypothetical protein